MKTRTAIIRASTGNWQHDKRNYFVVEFCYREDEVDYLQKHSMEMSSWSDAQQAARSWIVDEEF